MTAPKGTRRRQAANGVIQKKALRIGSRVLGPDWSEAIVDEIHDAHVVTHLVGSGARLTLPLRGLRWWYACHHGNDGFTCRYCRAAWHEFCEDVIEGARYALEVGDEDERKVAQRVARVFLPRRIRRAP